MKVEGVMKGWKGMRVGALVLAVLLCGVAVEARAQAQAQSLKVTTAPISGAVGDTVIASVVDTGIRTGASVVVTLRVVDGSGAVLAQTSGPVSESVPLRLSYRAAVHTGLSAQVLLPFTDVVLSVPVLTLERWPPVPRPSAVLPPPPRPEACMLPPTQRPPPEEGPVTLCKRMTPNCECTVVLPS
jgi:hypothetical protein